MNQASTPTADVAEASTRTVSVAIPTMDEEDTIADCIREVHEAFAAMDVEEEIIVSDSSTDRTPEIARALGATVVTPEEEGYGNAYRHAFELATGDVIVMGDGDGTYDFTELPTLVAEIDRGADVVLGNRLAGRIEPGAMPWLHRYVGNPVLTRFLNRFYGTDVTDTHTGFRALTREVIERLEFRSVGMEFASELIMQAKAAGFTIVEVPVSYRERVGESTLDSFTDGWRHLRFMLVNSPEDLFVVPGLALLACGAFLVATAGLDLRPFGQEFNINSMIAGSLFALVGWQVVSLGVFSGYAESIQPKQGHVGRAIRETFSLERGILLGLLILLPGIAIAGVQLFVWVTSGFERLPVPTYGLVAATCIALGIQTVFHSFFISVLSEAP